MKNQKIITFLAVLSLVGCTPKISKVHNPIFGDALQDGIFSNRPQGNIKQTILLLKLQSPPLLAALSKDRQVSEALAAQIEKEQATFIQRLQRLSSEIKVVFKYRMVLNAISVVAPLQFRAQILSVPGVQMVENSGSFTRPEALQDTSSLIETLSEKNSVGFIGADKAHEMGFRGQGMRVGIIDTGIDYTHAMLGGSGAEGLYASLKPEETNEHFPNKKVVGGIDLVGTNYDAAADTFERRLPRPDSNPLDEGGHGSHVAGTVAGLGDGVNTYSGVSPEASLYAIKVFGAGGSTSDEVVIAGLEYAADPNGDMKLDDQLHVVNLSLGSSYGTSHNMYSEAVATLTQGGTVVVASAGNSGEQEYIVGSPSTAPEAISVAAGVDDMAHNWKFDAVKFIFTNQETENVEAIEGPASKKISETGDVQGSLFYVGTANEDFTEAQKELIKGKVALIDRGVKPFYEKLTRVAQAGAIGAVMVNNQDGEPFAMGMSSATDKPVEIPAIMVRKSLGAKVKEQLASNQDVQIHFKSDVQIEKPELIDTIADFSSQGPRSEDALLKPEITAPGQSIVSAAMGKGRQGVKFSGTSMSAPHIAGVMILLKQKYPEMSSNELKSVLMGTAKTIVNKDKKTYPVSRMGAGRVQVDRAIQSVLLTETPSISLGRMRIENQKSVHRRMIIKNISAEKQNLSLRLEGSAQLELVSNPQFEIEAGAEKAFDVLLKVNSKDLGDSPVEASGIIKMLKGDQEVYRIPVLGILSKVSDIKSSSLRVHSTSELDSAGSLAELTLRNQSQQSGSALLFNSLGLDDRKSVAGANSAVSRACDLQAAGYRVVNGKFQLAVKLYESVSTWHQCEISMLIDTNGDSEAEQELVGVPMERLEGLAGVDFKAMLLDATKARTIRKVFEDSLSSVDPKKVVKPNYIPALINGDEMKVYNSSTIAILQIDLASLGLRTNGDFAVKIATSSQEDLNIEADDFLGPKDQWIKLDLQKNGQAYSMDEEEISLKSQEQKTIFLEKGEGNHQLMILYPHNRSVLGSQFGDQQIELLSPTFQP